MDASEPKRRWFYPTPGWLVILSLAVTGVLFLSERFQWFGFNTHKGWTVLLAVAAVGLFLALMLVWLLIALAFRMRFQYSIRSLLLLVVAVSLPCSWFAVEMKKAREQRAIVDGIRQLNGEVQYDWRIDAIGDELPNSQAPQLHGCRAVLGDDFLSNVSLVNLKTANATAADLNQLPNLSQLRILWIHDLQVSDTVLEQLKKLDHLEELELVGSCVTDARLEQLRWLKQLRRLGLDSAPITDAGLVVLAGLPNLQSLFLNYPPNITDQGVEKLHQMLPRCQIVRRKYISTDTHRERTYLAELRLTALFRHSNEATQADVDELQRLLQHCQIIRKQ